MDTGASRIYLPENSSRTPHPTHLISHNLISLNSSHLITNLTKLNSPHLHKLNSWTTHVAKTQLPQLISHFCVALHLEQLLRGRCSTLCTRDVLLRGRRGTLTLWALPVRAWAPVGPGCIYVAGATLCASGATFAWQVQHLVHMDLLLHRDNIWCQC